eukprot:12912204-Prorocentrum_lima.AAC.1
MSKQRGKTSTVPVVQRDWGGAPLFSLRKEMERWPLRTLLFKRVLPVGSDCSGMGAFTFALKRLPMREG